jgi:ribosome biogenesis GTPase A
MFRHHTPTEADYVDNEAPNKQIVSEIGRITAIRERFGQRASELAAFLLSGEDENRHASGALEITPSIDELARLGDRLGHGIFRLLVMGDVKRGKSTFINVLLGEQVLPQT